jgi:hypothetical protein
VAGVGDLPTEDMLATMRATIRAATIGVATIGVGAGWDRHDQP